VSFKGSRTQTIIQRDWDQVTETLVDHGLITPTGLFLVPTFLSQKTVDGILMNLTEAEENELELKKSYNNNQEAIESLLYWRDLAEQQLQEHMAGLPADMDTIKDMEKEFTKLDLELKLYTEKQSTIARDLHTLSLEALTLKAMTDLRGKHYANQVFNIHSFVKKYLSVSLKHTPLSASWLFFIQNLEEEQALSQDFKAEHWEAELQGNEPILLQDWFKADCIFEVVSTTAEYDFFLDNYVF